MDKEGGVWGGEVGWRERDKLLIRCATRCILIMFWDVFFGVWVLGYSLDETLMEDMI